MLSIFSLLRSLSTCKLYIQAVPYARGNRRGRYEADICFGEQKMKKTRFLAGILAVAFVVGMFALVAEATQTLQRPRQRSQAEWNEFFRGATEEAMRYELRQGLNPMRAVYTVVRHNPNGGAMRALLDAGVDVNARLSFNETLLGIAVLNNVEIARVLVESGADINAQTGGGAGNTALRIAASGGSPEMVIFLLEAGADPTIGGVSFGARPRPFYTSPTVIRNLEGTEALRLLERRYRELSR